MPHNNALKICKIVTNYNDYLYIGGTAAEYVSSLKHLGHVLGNACSDSVKILR